MVEKEIHICSICSQKFENYSEALNHVEDSHKEELDESGSNAEWYVVSQMVNEEELNDVVATTEEPIGKAYDSEEEIEDEDRIQVLSKKMLENWSKISDKDRSQILNTMFETFAREKEKPKNDIDYLKRTLQIIENGRCPICDLDHQKLGSDNLPQDENLAKYKEGLVWNHIRISHKDFFEKFYSLVVGVQLPLVQEPIKNEPPRMAETPNPESCAKMSKEQLASEIAKDEKLREILFRRYLKEKKTKD